MTISRQTIGLILLEECDSLGAWTKQHTASAYQSVDTTDKQSGTASFLTTSSNSTSPYYSYGAFTKQLNMGTGVGRLIRIFYKVHNAGVGITVGAFAVYTTDWKSPVVRVGTVGGATTWSTATYETPAGNPEGIQNCELAFAYAFSGSTIHADRLVICQSKNLILADLAVGQTVLLYRASGTFLDTQTVAAGASSVTFDVSAENVPENMYFKIYASDGTTLIETTTTCEMCGGDEWTWTASPGTLTLAADAFIILASSTGSPTAAPYVVRATATLRRLNGDPYTGEAISIIVGRPDAVTYCDSSLTTDSNGEAWYEFNSTVGGLQVVAAIWGGDSTVPSATVHVVVHVFAALEKLDKNKNFQLYVEGTEYEFNGGNYYLCSENVLGQFEVTVPTWPDVKPVVMGLVSIYRKGVKEFAGVLKIVERGLLPKTITLTGPDISCLLDSVTVDYESYSAKTPQYILNDLITKFPCGLTVGNLETYSGDPISLDILNLKLREAIKKVCDVVGWIYRVNMDYSFDAGSSFGTYSSAAFVEGDTDNPLLPGCRVTPDYTVASNDIHSRGAGEANSSLSSTAQDAASIMEIGPQQAPVFQKTLSHQGTLDTSARAELKRRTRRTA